MCMREWMCLLVCCACVAACTAPAPRAVSPALGQAASPGMLAAWSTTIFPDGRGLPAGRGSVAEGARLYRERCMACHGEAGRGGSGGHLVGRGPLTGPDPDQTVGSYWPYATTVFDFIRRAMPMDKPATLSADETYALTAYLLHLNSIVAETAALDATTLPAVRMPNRDGFARIDAP